MLEFLTSAPDVIAVRLRGKMTRQDVETLTDRIEASLAEREQTHVYAEIEDFSGLEMDGMTDHMRRGAAMLGKLRRFGRVAIVADEAWLRWLAKIESALLPGISYETFTLEKRERALSWVEGRERLPHGPALKLIKTSRPDVHGFELDGKLSAAEMKAASAYFNRLLAEGRPLRLLGRIKNVGGLEMTGLDSSYFSMKRGMLDRLERYAVVGGPAWIRTAVNIMGSLFKPEVRHFEAEEEANAWSGWERKLFRKNQWQNRRRRCPQHRPCGAIRRSGHG